MSESDDPPDGPLRRANGTFKKGSSGNPKGRPPKDRLIPHPENIRDMHYDVAEFRITGSIRGEPHIMNLLQANLMTLGLAGAGGDKKSATEFVSQISRMSEQELRNMNFHLKRLDPVHPAYLTEDDPVRRARLEEAWHNAMAEATGERKRTTKGIRKKRGA